MNLTNKRILITRPRAQAEQFANALAAEGAHPIFFPVIEIVAPDDFSDFDRALQNLNQYDWIIFTSIHSVNAFFKRLDTLGIKLIPQHMRVAAIGSKTARSLYERWVAPNFIPTEYIAEAILSGLGKDISGKRFLLPQSNIAREFLAKEIRCAGGIADEVVAYRNIACPPDINGLNTLRMGVDVITFTSPSSVMNFVDIVRENGLDPLNLPGAPLIACIGPITKKTAEDAGFTNIVSANKYTTDGLIELICNLVHL